MSTEAKLPLDAAAGSAEELAKRIPFRMVMHMSFSAEHHLDYLNEPLNLACCITTKYRTGNVVAAVASFVIPGLGQLAQGRFVAGVIHFAICAALWFVLLGWVINILSALDAANHGKS